MVDDVSSDVEAELASWAAENIAMLLILQALIRQLKHLSPNGLDIMRIAFDEADEMAEALILRVGNKGHPDHTGKYFAQ